MSDYRVTLHVYNSSLHGVIPHSFVTLQASGHDPLVIGYYPQETGVEGPGTVRNDAITSKDIYDKPSQHPAQFTKTFHVSPGQYANMLAFAEKTANNPGHYQLIGEPNKSNWLAIPGYQCTGFAREILSKGDIHPERWRNSVPGTARAVPAMLAEEYRHISADQVKPYRTSLTDKQINDQVESLKNGIKRHDPKDPNFQKPQQLPNGAPPSALDRIENNIKNIYKPFAENINERDLTAPAHTLNASPAIQKIASLPETPSLIDAKAPQVRPPGGYPEPTEAQWNDNSKPLRIYNQQDGTSTLYTFNADGVLLREQNLNVKGVDMHSTVTIDKNPQINVAQEHSQHMRLTREM
jgi:hypothetical protein